jgi:hypothetical protein
MTRSIFEFHRIFVELFIVKYFKNQLPAVSNMESLVACMKLFREEPEGGIPGPPSYFTRRGDGIPVPALHKFMPG